MPTFEEAGARLGRDVAPVGEGVDADALDAALGRHLEQRLAVAHLGVDATVGDEAHDVEGAAVGDDAVHGLGEDLVGLEGAVLDRVVDQRERLVHDAAGTDVEVADLGVAHLAVGKADVLARGAERGGRVLLGQRVEEGPLGKRDRVLGAGGREAAAVHDDEEGGGANVTHYIAALTIAANESALREAPPTRAPSTSSFSRKPATFSGLAEPP